MEIANNNFNNPIQSFNFKDYLNNIKHKQARLEASLELSSFIRHPSYDYRKLLKDWLLIFQTELYRSLPQTVDDYHQKLLILADKNLLFYSDSKQELVDSVYMASILIQNTILKYVFANCLKLIEVEDFNDQICISLNEVCSNQLQTYILKNKIESSHLNVPILDLDQLYQFNIDTFSRYLKTPY